MTIISSWIFHNTGKISPSDCSDFDCDGFKKSIILDQDGSIAEDGVGGTIIPDSAYDMDNFFEEDVINNLASLLVIDPII